MEILFAGALGTGRKAENYPKTPLFLGNSMTIECRKFANFRERERGVENSGVEKHTLGPSPPPKRILEPPAYDTFPPPNLFKPYHMSLRDNAHRPNQSHFLRPPDVVLEGVLECTPSIA